MKVCLQCAQENENDAFWCRRCRHDGFASAPGLAPPHELDFPAAQSGPEFLITEKIGNLNVLKCRTPREAFLVAAELEAADILVNFPGEETMLKEFQSHGFVSLRVSARSYEAATELRTVIERQHWEERARQPLSIPMIFAAVAMGLFLFPGIMFLHSMNDSYKMKSYIRKARLLRRWFCVGLVLLFALLVLIASHDR